MMDRNYIVIIVILGTFFMSACTEPSPSISEEELIVVWAYLYAGEPVDDIRLTSTQPLDADSTAPPPINDAIITLIRDGHRYECELASGDSGYYKYSGSDLLIEEGDLFSLEIDYGGKLTTATTLVPGAPISLTLSASTMTVPDFSDRQAFREWRESENRQIVVSWENTDNSWYYVTLLNIEPNPIPFDSFFSGRAREFIFPPINDNTYSIRLPLIEHLGQHRVNVYKVNEEYVDLYESRDQDTRDLNEPLTNIKNGLGVFAAFNSASVILNVVQ